ncbi:ephrin-B3 precursor [Xenopus tropicalis]|uniref:Ephrin-B3 n=1 Tax=Xenopus tropicalis TaxID=8364 RepID=A8KBG7_XENTR|eukprot:NP_001106481.1 ephrin-B3 precursor [Xenopus tropicalis]
MFPREPPGALYVRVLLALWDLGILSALSLDPIYWNSANQRFEDAEGYVLYPQIGDRLDLLCPRSEPRGPFSSSSYEFYKLYLVGTKEEMLSCSILRTPNLLLTCDRPSQDLRFTIKFQEFSPNLWGHEFQSQRDYYIIATSDGTQDGLENLRGGVCETKGMKVTLKVGQNPNGAPPPRRPSSAGKDSGISPSVPNPDIPNFGAETSGNATKTGENGPLPISHVPLVAGAAGGAALLLLVFGVVGWICHRRRQAKHSDTRHPPLSLGSITSPKRGGGNNNGHEPSDIIMPLRPSDGGAFCPHYEKVSGDYGHPVYIVQDMASQSPANIYYKV